MDRLRRRQFLRIGGSTAGLVLLNGCSQVPFVSQPRARVAHIGLAWSGAQENTSQADAFRAGLRDAGWVEGQNLVIGERHYGDHPERMPELAAEMVAMKPDVLAGSQVPSVAFMRATDSIPIVFAAVPDPVGLGLVTSYARPGGNVTGTSRTAGSTLTRKLLDLLRQLVPGLARVAVLFAPSLPPSVIDFQDAQAAAQSLGVDAQAVAIGSSVDPERALAGALASQPRALLMVNGGVNPLLHPAVARFGTQHGLPTASTNTVTAGFCCTTGRTCLRSNIERATTTWIASCVERSRLTYLSSRRSSTSWSIARRREHWACPFRRNLLPRSRNGSTETRSDMC
jgi:putative ABC transport system substrate-binding protein